MKVGMNHSSVTLPVSGPLIVMTLVLSGLTNAQVVAPTGKALGVLRFDAILELNAPIMETHVVFFARYWVGRDHYSVGVVWAEPHEGNINFPCYPVTLAIESDREKFSLSHQVHQGPNAPFPKPVGRRGLFQHRFNAYDLNEIRFAEADATASRLYTPDLDLSSLPQDGWTERELSNRGEGVGDIGDIRKIKILTRSGRLEEMTLLDKDNEVLKTVDYEWRETESGWAVQSERIALPSRLLAAGGEGTTVTVKMHGKERVLNEFAIRHHAGGRSATVQYESTKLGSETITVPVRIVVKRTADGLLLRSVRMFNFARVNQGATECAQAARRFAALSGGEERCRQMLLKYWLKDPSDVNQADAEVLKSLHLDFTRQATEEIEPAMALKRINKCFEVDWMLGDGTTLKTDYSHYLSILKESDLSKTMLFGGWSVIETSVRWGFLRPANEMLRTWVDAVVPMQNVDSLLEFAHSQCERSRLWSTVVLAERLRQSPCSTEQRFEIEALRCEAIIKLVTSIERAEAVKSDFVVMQAGWVASQIDLATLRKMGRESLAESKLLYARLTEPSNRCNALKSRIEMTAQRVLEKNASQEDQ